MPQHADIIVVMKTISIVMMIMITSDVIFFTRVGQRTKESSPCGIEM